MDDYKAINTLQLMCNYQGMRLLITLVGALSTLLVVGFTILVVKMFKTEPQMSPNVPIAQTTKTLTQTTKTLVHKSLTKDAKPLVGFAPEAIIPLNQGFAVLLLATPKAQGWEVRIFSKDGEFQGGMGAYASPHQ